MAHHFDQHFRDMSLREPVNRNETHNICDKDDADGKQFQGAINLVDNDHTRVMSLCMIVV